MGISREARLKKVIPKLEKLYGKTAQPKKEFSSLDFLLYALIARHCSRDVADRSFKTLKSDFVDWNEMRVSSTREIGSSLKVRDEKARDETARSLRSVVSGLFQEKNRISLAFLESMEFEQGVKFLTSLDGVDPATAVQVMLFCGNDQEMLPNVAHVIRVSRRIGLVEKRFGPNRVREALSALVGKADVQRFHRLFVLHGTEICQTKSPQCSRCDIAEECVSSKAKVVSTRARKK